MILLYQKLEQRSGMAITMEKIKKERGIMRKSKKISLSFILTGLVVLLTACGTKFAEGDPYYYVLQQIPTSAGVDYRTDVQLYIVDPFEKKVFARALDDAGEIEEPYELNDYEDTDERFYIEYNEEEKDEFEKKSDSLWVSLETEIEYSAEKREGEFNYTPVTYEPLDDVSEAALKLSNQTFVKHIGEGAEKLSFTGNRKLILSFDDTLPPYIADLEDLKDYEGNESVTLENILLKDGESGDFIVMQDGEELFRLFFNEDELLETEDGTTYMQERKN